MKALVFTLRLNSLYSIRIPFTWQSALTYPVLPPSAVVGLIANALQRYKNDKPPREYLDLVSRQVDWAGSRLLTPCVIKSYTTSAVIKWKEALGSKFTNVYGRQFAYSKNLEVLVILKESGSNNSDVSIDVDVLCSALKSTPLTCGDGESSVSIETCEFYDIGSQIKLEPEQTIETEYIFQFDGKKMEIIEGHQFLYLMHDVDSIKNNKWTFASYIVPIKDENGVLRPDKVKVKIKDKGFIAYKVEEMTILKFERNDN